MKSVLNQENLQTMLSLHCDLVFWTFDLKVTVRQTTSSHCTSTKFSVGSLSHFHFRPRATRSAQTHRQNYRPTNLPMTSLLLVCVGMWLLCGVALTVKHILVKRPSLRDINEKFFINGTVKQLFDSANYHSIIYFIIFRANCNVCYLSFISA